MANAQINRARAIILKDTVELRCARSAGIASYVAPPVNGAT